MKDYVKDLIINNIYDYEDSAIYGAELSYTILESYNIDGSITYNTFKAKEWIKTYFDEIGEVVENIEGTYGAEFVGDICINLWKNPEAFMVIICLEKASELLSECKIIQDNWNSEIKLTKENINKIVEELKEV